MKEKHSNQKLRQNFSYKITEEDKMVGKCLTHFRRSFSQKIRTINWKDVVKNHQSIYLRVVYEDGLSNEGVYQDKDSFYLALNAFLED